MKITNLEKNIIAAIYKELNPSKKWPSVLCAEWGADAETKSLRKSIPKSRWIDSVTSIDKPVTLAVIAGKGQIKKAEIARAPMHTPRVLLVRGKSESHDIFPFKLEITSKLTAYFRAEDMKDRIAGVVDEIKNPKPKAKPAPKKKKSRKKKR